MHDFLEANEFRNLREKPVFLPLCYFIIRKPLYSSAQIDKMNVQSMPKSVEDLQAVILRVMNEMEKLKMENKDVTNEMEKLKMENKDLKKEGYIVEKGLPPLGPCLISVSEPGYGKHVNISKPPERIPDSDFALLSLHMDNNTPSKLWQRVESESGSLPEWNHETHIQSFCVDALKDIAALASVDIKIGCEVNLSIVEKQRADIVIFKCGGQLVGMCEVKKPSKSPSPSDLQNPQLDTQVCNYLQLMRSVHGCKCPIGIVSTYEHWIVIWLDTSHALATAKEMQPNLVSQPSQSDTEPLYCSKIVSRTDRDLPLFLATALVKMVNGETENIEVLFRTSGSNGRKFGKVTCNDSANKFCWEALPPLLKPTFELPPPNTTQFYLLRDFHGGADGRVWLACSATGKLCVIKLSTTHDFKVEADHWCKIWDVRARCTLIMDAHALIMPFAFHAVLCHGNKVVFRPLNNWCGSSYENISLQDFVDNCDIESTIDGKELEKWFGDPLSAALEAVSSMAHAGFVHNDLAWRHVALLPIKQEPLDTKPIWTVKPILIDLTRVRVLEEGETVEAVVENARLDLQKDLNSSS
eukprot:scaffold6281_cov207-Ochromonas_danica.AAC.5